MGQYLAPLKKVYNFMTPYLCQKKKFSKYLASLTADQSHKRDSYQCSASDASMSPYHYRLSLHVAAAGRAVFDSVVTIPTGATLVITVKSTSPLAVYLPVGWKWTH